MSVKDLINSRKCWSRRLYDLLWPDETTKHLKFDDLIEEKVLEVPIFPILTGHGYDDDDNDDDENEKFVSIPTRVLYLNKHPKYEKGTRKDYLPNSFLQDSFVVVNDYIHILKLREQNDMDFLQKIQRNIRARRSGACCIVGDPGIGKSVMIALFLIYRLLQGKSTIFVDVKGKCHVFHKHGFYIEKDIDHLILLDANFETEDQQFDTWMLIDGYRHEPLSGSYNFNMILVSSPKKEMYHSWLKQLGGVMYQVDAWAWQEIAALHLIEGTPFLRLWHAYFFFGGHPRTIALTCFDANDEEHQQRIQDRLVHVSQQAAIMASKDVQTFTPTVFNQDETHVLITTKPNLLDKDKKNWRPGQKRPVYVAGYEHQGDIEVATPYIQSVVAHAYAATLRAKGFEAFQNLYLTAFTKSSAGKLFEAFIHDIFTFGDFQNICQSLASVETTAHMAPALTTIGKLAGVHDFDSINQIRPYLTEGEAGPRTVKQSRRGIYMRPKSSVFTSVDSFYIHMITVATKHPVKASGLQKVWDTIPDEARKYGVYLVFIVPEFEAMNFKKQKIQAPTKEIEKVWNQRVHQMVAAVSLKKLWAEWLPLNQERPKIPVPSANSSNLDDDCKGSDEEMANA